MKTKEIFICEKCDKEFIDKSSCLNHEKLCETMINFKCDKCGNVTSFNPNDEFAFAEVNRCWPFDKGRAGYGSWLDGSDIKFNLCDACLYVFIKSFTPDGQDKVFNSGSNLY